MKSLQLLDGILCRKFETADNQVVLQQIVPPSMTQEILTACHSSPTAGHLGLAKTSEKIKQGFYWPGLQEDTKLFHSRCPECQRRSGPPKKYHHASAEWQASYPFHHIGIDFMGTLPLSKGNKHILVIGDHFTKWYEAIPLPIKRPPQLQTPELITGSADLVAQKACTVIKGASLNQNFLNK